MIYGALFPQSFVDGSLLLSWDVYLLGLLL